MGFVIFFIVALAAGVPVAFVLGGTGVIQALLADNPNVLLALPRSMFSGINNASLMAIPLFVLAGEFMGYGGITERLANMVRSFIGHVRGGMAYTTVGVGACLGALLGSANASAALLGRIMKPEMDKDGYDESFSASLCTATSMLGPIIPPSMNFIIFGVASSVSIGALFIAGIVPGILIALSFAALIFYYGIKSKNIWTIRPRQNFKEKGIALLKALPCLSVPVIILGGIFSGATTPTEAAATASLVAFILGKFVYNKLKWSDIPKILMQTGLISAVILFIVACATLMGFMLAWELVPHRIAALILSITTNKFVFLLLINLFLFGVGMIMETVAAVLILAPILLPIAVSYGIHPIHFGMVMCINLIIGLVTPPVGIALFTTAMVTKVPLRKLVKDIWPWVGVAVLILLLITYVPDIVLFLPNLIR